MVTNECQLCGELFWASDCDTDICVTCIESPDEDRRREQAAKQTTNYIRSLRAMARHAGPTGKPRGGVFSHPN